jgi:hypothetical protein
MSLSFHYLPDPLPPLFIPRYRSGSTRKRLLFYSAHAPRPKRQRRQQLLPPLTPSPLDTLPTPQ